MKECCNIKITNKADEKSIKTLKEIDNSKALSYQKVTGTSGRIEKDMMTRKSC